MLRLTKLKNVVFRHDLQCKYELTFQYCIFWPLECSKHEMKAKKRKKNLPPDPLEVHCHQHLQIQSPTLYQLSYVGKRFSRKIFSYLFSKSIWNNKKNAISPISIKIIDRNGWNCTSVLQHFNVIILNALTLVDVKIYSHLAKITWNQCIDY